MFYVRRCSPLPTVSSHRCRQIPPLFLIDYNLRRWLLSSGFSNIFVILVLTLIFLYILSNYSTFPIIFAFCCLVVFSLFFILYGLAKLFLFFACMWPFLNACVITESLTKASHSLSCLCLHFSLRHFVADAGDYTIAMVDDLLNVLTSGEHSKVMALLEEVRDRLSYWL